MFPSILIPLNTGEKIVLFQILNGLRDGTFRRHRVQLSPKERFHVWDRYTNQIARL